MTLHVCSSDRAKHPVCVQGLTRLRVVGLTFLVNPTAFCQQAAPLGATLTALSYNGGGMVRGTRSNFYLGVKVAHANEDALEHTASTVLPGTELR